MMDLATSENTKKQIKFSIRVFEEYLQAVNLTLDEVEQLPNSELDSLLSRFYGSVRTSKGEYYSKKSMQAIRFGLQRHFVSAKLVDIIAHADFVNSKKTFKSMMAVIKKEGKGSVKHKEAITREDMVTIQEYFDLNKPDDLQDKVFMDVMIYFCNRGRENLRQMTPDQFEITGEPGSRSITKKDTLTKNNRENHDETSQGGVMTEIPGNPRCPVSSLLKYLEKLNPKCEALWQRARSAVSDDDAVWYCDSSVGKNTLFDKMKSISLKAGTSQVYTNHCLRATSVTILDEAGFEARDIMTVSGHHAETSIKSYARTSSAKKKRMSTAIASVLAPSPEVPAQPVVEIPPLDMMMEEIDLASGLVDVPVDMVDRDEDLTKALQDISNLSQEINQEININNSSNSNHKIQFNFSGCVVNIHN